MGRLPLAHGGLTTVPIRDFIYAFHMPLFFILSGVLYRQRSVKETFLKQWRMLLVPYFIINIMALLYYLLYYMFFGGFDLLQFVNTRIVPVFLGLGYNVGEYKPVSTPTWFFIVLFFTLMLMAICRSDRLKVIAVVACMLGSKILSWLHIDTYVPFDSAMLAFPFVAVGYFSQRFITPPSGDKGILLLRSQALLLPLMVVLLILLHIVNGRIDINLGKIGNSYILMYINGILGSLMVMLVAMRFTSYSAIASVLASGGMLVVGFNLFAIDYAKRLWKFMTGYQIDEMVGMLLCIVILSAFYVVILFCKRYFKIILGYR